ncbi:hypothetical protein TSAR_007553 [Trichomalopsis sarcophagae]|uniref:Uncharacterized protein n=1 Tax=Trichomalopsis sarcophagae TaxID=543379 RepID=A0A232FED8_9HYME|nr:hypothetical protein TSAR_007553 [Trichomalopsis sarcophagae]
MINIDKKAKQKENKTNINASTDRTDSRNRAHSSSEKTTAPREKGRPVGAKTNKNAPELDHSVIAQRTRGRRAKVESPIATYIMQGAIPKVPKSIKHAKINNPVEKPFLKATKSASETIATSEEESSKGTQSDTDSEAPTSRKFSSSRRSWLSSTALAGRDPDLDGDTLSTDSQNRTISNIKVLVNAEEP